MVESNPKVIRDKGAGGSLCGQSNPKVIRRKGGVFPCVVIGSGSGVIIESELMRGPNDKARVCLNAEKYAYFTLPSLLHSSLTTPRARQIRQNSLHRIPVLRLKHPYFNGGLTVYSNLKENVYQNAKFSTEFPTLKKDFSELRKFQPKP